jgi:hypothetical protein
MSRLFGDIFQLAYVVEDLDAAMAHWTQNIGVGPFYRFPVPLVFDEVAIRGQQLALDADIFGGVGIAYSGNTMIELIQPGSVPSPYREFLAAGRSGAHHVGTYATDYDAQLAAAKAAGIKVVFEGKLPMSRFVYLETDLLYPGTMVELVEPAQAMIDLFDLVKAAARDWDGSDPVRSL